MRTSARRGHGQFGEPLRSFLPREALNAMNDVERRASWTYLRTVPPVPFGHR